MAMNDRKSYFFGFVIYLVFMTSVRGQMKLSEIENLDSVINAISTPIYKLEYFKANENIAKLESLVPGHPIVDFLFALNEVWQSIPDSKPANFTPRYPRRLPLRR